MTLLRKCNYLIYIGILFCILILLVFYIKDMIYARKKLEQFEAQVLEYHDSDANSSSKEKALLLSLTKLDNQQNANSKYDKHIDESHLRKV